MKNENNQDYDKDVYINGFINISLIPEVELNSLISSLSISILDYLKNKNNDNVDKPP